MDRLLDDWIPGMGGLADRDFLSDGNDPAPPGLVDHVLASAAGTEDRPTELKDSRYFPWNSLAKSVPLRN
jgi:hypothetical protein